MLDREFVVRNLEAVKRNNARRLRDVDLDAFVKHEAARKAIQAKLDYARNQSKSVSKSDKTLEERKREGRALRDQIRKLEEELDFAVKAADALLLSLPNLTHPSSPDGEDESDAITVCESRWPIRKAEFVAKDHVELGRALDIIDIDSARKISGPGFYFLKGDGVLLEMALQQLALQHMTKHGFLAHVVPELVRDEFMSATGYSPRGSETNTYSLQDMDMSLIATSEIPLCAMHADRTFLSEELPILSCGISRCFRTERAAGQATRGIYRVHQFSKVEMVVICLPKDSEEWLDRLVAIEREIFDDLELPYRVIDIASGDLGNSAYRKYDIEAWMPGRYGHGAFGEVTSASNCTDYQARRLAIRYQKDGETKFVHTLNATGIATTRAMIALLENHQEADGSVVLPEKLRPLMRKDRLQVG